GQQSVAGAQKSEQRRSKRVSARHYLRRNYRRFRAENVGEHFAEGISSYIVVSVAVGLCEMSLTDAVFEKRREDFFLVEKRDLVRFFCIGGNGSFDFRHKVVCFF